MSDSSVILVIDDNRAWLETLAEYLRDKGFSVLTASDAFRGLALLDKNEVSLVVCDYNLPDMNGLDLIRHLQAHQGQVAILMLTGEEEPSLAKRALSEGAKAFLTKSTSPRILLRRLRQMMDAVHASLTLSPWQRLLPSPQRIGQPRTKRRSKAG